MDRSKILLYINSALYSLWALLTAGSVIKIHREGAAWQAQGHPEAWIFTREKAAEAFGTCLPVLVLAVAVTVICVMKGIHDDRQDKPVADPDLVGIYKAERDAEAEAVKAKRLRNARTALLIVAVILVIAGIFNGSMEDMLIKAINICTECVGLG